MKTNRIAFILLACLLGVVGGWLVGHRSSNPQVATPSSQTAPDPVPVAETVAHSTPPRKSPIESSREVRAEPVQASREIQPAAVDLGLTETNSPVNSQDLDQNREWARNFQAGALAWLKNAPEGEQRTIIAEIACSDMAQTNPVAAVTLAEDCLGSGTNSAAQYLLSNMAQQWADHDLQAASAWALAKPEGEQRDSLLQRIAMVQAQTDPAGAATMLVQQMQPGATQNEAAISVLYQWAQKDAAAALAWAEAFPAGDLRDRAILEVKNVSAATAEPAP
jgi:hypothetical protein